MATTPIEFHAPQGLTLRLDLYPFGSDTRANGSGDTATERANAKGVYSADATEPLTGLHNAVIIQPSGSVLIANYVVNIRADDTTIYRCADDVYGAVALPDAQLNNFDPAVDVVSQVTLVDTTTTNTDMRGTDDALLAISAPTNFGDLSITTPDGRVDVTLIEGIDATDQIRDAVIDDATRLDGSALNGLAANDPGSTIAAQSDITALNDLSATEVKAQADQALVDIGLDHLVSVAVVGADITDNTIIARIVSDGTPADWDDFSNLTDSLMGIRTNQGDPDTTLANDILSIPTAIENADAYLDRTDGVETGVTPRQQMRVGLAADAGKLSGSVPGSASTILIRDQADTKNRISATTDKNGNRLTTTLDTS